MSGISGKMIYTWEGKELSTLNETEKASAREWLKGDHTSNIQDYSEVSRLLQPKKKIDTAISKIYETLDPCMYKTIEEHLKVFRNILSEVYGEE